MFRLERWKAGALLGSWIVYWAALLGVTIGPGLLKAWRLTRQVGSHGSMSASIDGGKLLFIVNDTGSAGVWSFSTSVATALAWIALPPLALWVLWLISRPRRDILQPSSEAPLALSRAAMPLSGGVRAPLQRPAAEHAERGEHMERSS